MASNIELFDVLTEDEILCLDIKELNKIFKTKNLTKREQLAIKAHRRKIKMKKYRKDSRMRKPINRALLLDEYLCLTLEVLYLQYYKAWLIEQLSSDDEYGEFVIVD